MCFMKCSCGKLVLQDREAAAEKKGHCAEAVIAELRRDHGKVSDRLERAVEFMIDGVRSSREILKE